MDIHLIELSFRDIASDALDMPLNQVACPALSHLKIKPARDTQFTLPAYLR
jgi:hypothetical protein